MKHFNHRNVYAGIVVAGSFFALAASAAAFAGEPVLETISSSTYVNGGIGQSDQARMRRIAPEFPLRMTFSEHRDGEFVADVPVTITDPRGTPVFELAKAGPVLFVDLPDGHYRVSATLHGVTESRVVDVESKRGKDLHFNWQGRPTG